MLIRSCPFQVTLLEESWSELFLLCAIQWCLPFEKPSLFAITEYEVVSAESVALLNHLTLMYNRYKRFNVNPAEFACMKAILLFKPGTILTISLHVARYNKYIIPVGTFSLFRSFGISVNDAIPGP